MILRQLSQRFSIIQTKLFHGVKYSKEGTFNALPSTVFHCIKNTQDYSEFIPWCSKSSIVKNISRTQNLTQLTITFQKVKQLSYLSHVNIFGQNNTDSKYKVQSICKEQPLKSLVSIWEIDKNSIIQGNSQQTFVKYSIQYQFSSPILQLTSHFFLDYVGESMWVIFKDQAEKTKKSISQNSISSQSFKNQNKSLMTFGKSKTISNQKVQQTQSLETKTQIQQKKATNLADYLGKNPKIHQIYCKNNEFRKKLDDWSKLLDKTKEFEQKLQFNIKNYLIHKS